jgi:hypothetical protein
MTTTFTQQIADKYAYTTERFGNFASSVNEQVNRVITASAEKITNVTKPAVDALASLVEGDTYLARVYHPAKDLISANSLYLKYGAAAIGGVTAVNSTITLLQNKENQTKREFAKVAAGAGIVALSLYSGSEDERASIVNAAIAPALVSAIWKAGTAAKSTFFVFKLTPRAPLQNDVTVLPTANN